MRMTSFPSILALTVLASVAACAELPAEAPQAQIGQGPDQIATLVGRLDLERYKATIRGLTQFGDRREGTDRNRAAVNWIEEQLLSYGCTNIGRVVYRVQPPAPAVPIAPPRTVGGGRLRGPIVQPPPNNDLNAQPDPRLRELNAQEPTEDPRSEVYCTKVGTVHPDKMYIVSAHMDGRGFGEAANDDGSGTALVMELARIFSAPDVETDISVRFMLFNSEEGGLRGSRNYVEQRRALQGREDPAGSGLYPEPTWLGVIQHDMMLFDHGRPNPDGTINPRQRAEADINIEFQINSQFARDSQDLAWVLNTANEDYASEYPASVGSHMTNTDSGPFQDFVAAVSIRENERGIHIGNGWDPQWHQPTDLYATYADEDFRLGLNAAQTTAAAIARLAGASIGE
jgi:hypothetical protein